MNKDSFLKRNKKFIEFLQSIIVGEHSINHSYLDEAFNFRTLEDAFNAYVFPFKSTSANKYRRNPRQWREDNKEKLFPKNKEKLEYIKAKLKQEFDKEKPDGERFLEAVKQALYWGATGEVVIPDGTKRKGTYAANVLWLKANYPENIDLFTDFKDAVEEIESSDFSSLRFGRESNYRMNAGFTKVYALLAKDSIIYDGRVGAALGFIVTLFLRETGENFTDDLNFYWGASESAKRFRNPSIADEGWVFTKLSNSNESAWAKCNVKANWLLTAAIHNLPDQSLFGGYHKSKMLHAVEAALFMLGYDFPALGQSMKLAPEIKQDNRNNYPSTRPTNKKVTATEVRSFVLELLSNNLSLETNFDFTSSDIKSYIGIDLTAICAALKMQKYFNERNFSLEVMDAPSSGLGKVTYRATMIKQNVL